MIFGFTRRFGLLMLLASLSWMQAHAQTWPDKDREFRVICGFPAGSGADIVVRYYANKLAAVSGQKVIVENKAGMISALAAETVARAKPDGYTIFINPANSSHAANLFLFKKLPYDPIKDFTPVTTLHSLFFVLTVDPDSPYKSVKELTDGLKKKGDQVSYATTSPTSLVSAELYKSGSGFKALGIPYKNYPESFPEMRLGKIDFQFIDSGFAAELLRSGKLRGLAITAGQRSSLMPDLPTMIEAAGIPEYDIRGWFAVFLPAKVPQPVVDKLEGWFNQIVTMDDTKRFLANVGSEPMPGSAKSLAELLPKEIKKWEKLIKLAKIEPQ